VSKRWHPRSGWIVWIGAASLFLLHHDFWYWNDRTLVMGFLPIGLAYHFAYSMAAALLWAGAVRFAWPRHIEEWADQPAPSRPQSPVRMKS